MRFFIKMISLIVGLLMSTQTFAKDFAMTSTAFLDGSAMPVLYTCDGKDISPPLAWSNPPPKTQSYALIVSDPDASTGTFYHWVLYNIPASTRELPENVKNLPAGTLVGKNDFGKTRYNGPCPPKGSMHHYHFTLYALDSKMPLAAGADAKTVLDAIKSYTLKDIKLTGVYNRWLR